MALRAHLRRRLPYLSGFTLIELLVVITIIGILISLLLPAVQSAREAARRTQCVNNLKQMGLAVQNFESAKQRYPNGGACPWSWTPRNVYVRQGPGWAYQILPFIEQMSLYTQTSTTVIEQTPLQIYFCPTRRAPAQCPSQGNRAMMDYASATPEATINNLNTYWGGNTWEVDKTDDTKYYGIIIRSGLTRMTTPGSIRDGLSNTLLIGEKMVLTSKYETGDWCDDRGWTDGWDPDLVRSTAYKPYMDQESPSIPDGQNHGYHFGSAHQGGMNAVFGDGSVHMVSYSIDGNVFNHLGHGSDGSIHGASSLGL